MDKLPEKHYRSIVKSMPEGYYRSTPDGKFLEMNRAFASILGYRSMKELMSVNISKALYFHAEDESRYRKDRSESKLGKTVVVRLKKKDGNEIWVEDSSHVVRHKDGEIAFFEGMIRDVTERKIRERELKAWQERFEVVLSTTDQIIYEWDVLKDTTIWGGSPQHVLGYTVEEVPKNREKWQSLIHPDDAIRTYKKINLALENEEKTEIEYRIRRKNGTYCVMSDRAHIFRNEEGEAVRVTGCMQDITERKGFENNLRNIAEGLSGETGEEFFRSLVENLAKTLDMEYAYVGRLLGGEEGAIKTIAVWAVDGIADNFEYKLAGTPCENVISEEFCYFPKGVRKLFPNDGLLAELEIESYVGILLFDSKRQVMGNLAVLNRSPIIVTESTKSMLQIFAVRASSELERMRTQEEIQLSLSLQRATLESTADGILVVDGNGKIVSFNRKFAEMWRIPDSILESRDDDKAREFVLDQLKDPDAFLAKVRELNDQLDAESYDVLEFKDGKIFERYSQPQSLEGKPVGRVWSFRDITDRLHVEEALRKSQEQYKYLVEHANDIFYRMDATGHITFFNPTALKVMKYTEDEFRGKHYLDIVLPDFRETVEKFYNKQYADGVTNTYYELPVFDKNGEEVWLGQNVQLIYENGDVVGFQAMARDITERKLAEMALRESEEQYRRLVEYSPYPIAVHSEGAVVYVNSAAVNLMGVESAEELVGLPVFDFVHPDYKERVIERVKRISAGEELESLVEEKFLGLDGREIDVEVAAMPVVFRDKPSIQVVFRDITERKRAEREQRAHIKYMEGINQISEAIQLKADLEVTLQEVTRQLLSIFKCDRAGLLYPCDPTAESYRVLYETTKPEYPGGLAFGRDIPMEQLEVEVFTMALDSDNPDVWGPQRPFPAGSEIVEKFNMKSQMVMALRTKIGKPWLMILHQCSYAREWTGEEKALLKDISHRVTDALDKMLLYRDLLSSEEKYRTLVENAEDAIYIIKGGKFVVINYAFKDMFGYTLEETNAEDFDFMNLVAPESLELIAQRSEARDRGEDIPSRYEFRGISRKGEKIDLEVSTSPIEYEGQLAVLGILRDVTEKKNAEEERRELREKLERAERMESLGVLAGGVAHDLNNILGPVLAYPDLILSTMPADSELRDDIIQIRNAAKKAADTVSDLLTLARRGKYEMKPVSLNKLISSFIESSGFHEMQSRFYSVLFEKDLDEDAMNIKGSESHLLKVIMNLINNGFESMPHGGTLRVSTQNLILEAPMIVFEEIPEGEYMLVEVEDNGFGIGEEDLPRIFEPFYTKKKMGRSGTGLGLAVVWGVVKDHYGYMDVTTKQGVGSKFSLYFPVSYQELEDIPKHEHDYRGDETIMVVDDVVEQRELARRLLSSLGYTIKTVESGSEAINLLRREAFDLIILDMIMQEDFDGLDTYKEIIKIRPGQKALIASGFSKTARVKEALKMGVGGFIKKPYSLKSLGKAVKERLKEK